MPLPRLPKKVWIGTYEATLEVVNPTHAELKNADDDDHARGMTDTGDQPRIFIADNLTMVQQLEVVIHELTHVINYAFSIDDGSTEEDVADAQGKGWSAALIANPKLSRWLTGMGTAIRKEQQSA
jgi:hypothetical protein